MLMLLSQGVLLLASVALGGVTLRTYRDHETPVARSFSYLLALLAVTALCLGVTAGTGAVNKLIWLFTNLSIPVVVLVFACNYYGITLVRSRERIIALVTPSVLGLAAGTVLIFGTPQMVAGPEPPLSTVATLPTVVFETATTLDQIGTYYSAGLVSVAIGVVTLNIFRYDHLDTRLAGSIAFIGAWPWFGNFVVPDLTAAYGDAAALGALAGGYATSVLVAIVVVGPLGLLESSPAAGNVGPDHVLASMEDAVVIADDKGRVLRLNATACDTFGVTERSVIGRPVETVTGASSTLLDDDDSVSLNTVDGVRQFAVTRSPVTDGHEYERGTVFVFRDITTRQTREQRLEVLNRVLRHNLRTNANSIIGRANLITEGRSTEESAKEIIETTENLVGIAKTAREIEEMMAATDQDEVTALPDVVDTVVTKLEQEYPPVEVTTALPADATAGVSQHALTTVLWHLAENAVEHNDAAEPFVVISADSHPDTLTIAVSDNGPGIPAQEQAVIEAGEEDQLQHGSGLGLWAVHWGVTQMGGELSISENDPRGTTVSITVPTAKSADADLEETPTENESVTA